MFSGCHSPKYKRDRVHINQQVRPCFLATVLAPALDSEMVVQEGASHVAATERAMNKPPHDPVVGPAGHAPLLSGSKVKSQRKKVHPS